MNLKNSAVFSHIKHYTNSLLFSYSNLLFVKSRFLGVILLGVTLFNLNMAITGFISWVTTFLFGAFIGLKRNDDIASVFTYNSLLVGFAIGSLFKFSILSALLTVGASILTVLLSYSLYSIFLTYLKLPVLNIPFTIITMLIYLASARYSALLLDTFNTLTYLNLDFLPQTLSGLFRSAGILIFLPYDITGIIVITGLLLISRIAFLLTISSYFVGISILAFFKSGFQVVYPEFYAFNFILIGIAIGSVYLIPSKRSYILAMISVIISVFILDASAVFWSRFGVPILTLPFNTVVLLMIYVLNNLEHKRINKLIKETPEKSLEHYLNYSSRFDNKYPRPFLPFSGIWNVYQGNNGKWTHVGNWSNAIDFNIVRDGKSYNNEGKYITDYYCFGKPILSPITGVVTAVLDSLEDNPIGEVDKISNWGNYVIIYSDFGYYVELSHLKKNSIKVKTGDRVTVNQHIADCGNSGYSPEPHLHMQVQYWHLIGSKSEKFFFSNAMEIESNTIVSELKEGYSYTPKLLSKPMSRKVQFIMDEKFRYNFFINETLQSNVTLLVKLNEFGVYYFEYLETGEKLYFGIEDSSFVCYSYEGKRLSPLNIFMIAMPKLPLFDGKFHYTETIPLFLIKSWVKTPLWYISLINKSIQPIGHFYNSEREVLGEINIKNKTIKTSVEIGQYNGFEKISVKYENKIYELRKEK